MNNPQNDINVVKDFVKDFVKEIPQEISRELSERQLVILGLIASDSTISAKAISKKVSEKLSHKISEKNTVTERTIQNDIAQLKKLGILRRKGGRKNGEWEIVKGKEC